MMGLSPAATPQQSDEAGAAAMYPAPPPAPGAPAVAKAPPGEAGLSRTILGVARPGIAPLEPGTRKEPQQPVAQQHPAQSYGGAATAAPPETMQSSLDQPALPPLPELSDATATSFPVPSAPPPTLPSGITRPAPRGVPVLAAMAVTLAAALFAAGVVLLVLHKGTGPIEGRAVLGADGKERLEIVCNECPDGTRVALGRAVTTLAGHRGSLEPPQRLKVGENKLTLLLSRPGDKKSSSVALPIPIQYRVRADTSPLSELNPRLRVLVEALPNSKVTVDGKPLVLAADGRAVHDIDVKSELLGAEGSIKKLERSVPYTVTPPGGTAESGKVTFQLGITTLLVEAPGQRITIDTPTFVLSGRSLRGASVEVAGRPITLDAEGRFAQVMSVSSEGETTITVRAAAAEHAPRLYAIQIKRVARLADEAARLRPAAVASYASLGNGNEHAGDEVALDGTLLEHRAEGYASYLLVDVSSGCKTPPCLLRVVHGAPVRLAQGSPLSVFGRVTGSVEGARTGTRVPEVFASFLLPGSK
jgi:hypothetical protein